MFVFVARIVRPFSIPLLDLRMRTPHVNDIEIALEIDGTNSKLELELSRLNSSFVIVLSWMTRFNWLISRSWEGSLKEKTWIPEIFLSFCDYYIKFIYLWISFLERFLINVGLKLMEFYEVYMRCEKKRSKRNLILKERNWILEIGFYCNQ